jgi:DNA (cytosine-5)-methyltransferase 1
MDFVRLVAELDAKTFVFENVKGLTVGKQRAFLDELVDAFSSHGYEVRMPWRVLNAAMYGVPQNRQRLILFGSKKGVRLPNYPLPTTTPADDTSNILGLPFGPTCKDALGDLPDAESFQTLSDTDVVETRSLRTPSSYAAEMRCMSDAAWHFGEPRKWNSLTLTSSARTDHSAISRRRFLSTAQGGVEPISRFFKLPQSGVSNTLRAGTDGARGAFTSPRPIHFQYPRCVTVREMARLHGFPDWFRFHATKWHGARQVGNSVPPPLARAIAGEVIKALGVKPLRCSTPISLGNPALLYMELAEASEYFGVEKPFSKRDRKSGAKKRKQTEIEYSLNRTRVANG